ncbi:MAG: hypothetical protein ACRDKH_09290 [Solirubrobacterales bacterium]
MLALGSILILAALALPGGAPAAPPGTPPTITGNTVVGETLTASSTTSGTGVYRWQSCDPAVSADCSGAGGASDPNYVDIAGGNGLQTYTLTAAELGKFIRVLAHSTVQGDRGFVASARVGPVTAPPPGSLLAGATQLGIAPQHGVSLLGQPSRGVVKLKFPGQKKFSKMSGIQLIPVGTVIDTRKGTVELIAGVGVFANTDPDSLMEFFDGLFKIKQADVTDAPALAKLMGKLRCGGKKKKRGAAAAAAGPVAQAAGRRKRRLWGRGRGNYGTRGRGGTGSVVGTTWFTKDTCAGTFWKVTEGAGISIDAKGKRKDVFLEPGETYFAEV